MPTFLIAALAGVGALLFAGILAYRVMQAEQGNQRMRDIGEAIRLGSMAFLRREYTVLIPFVVVVAGVLWIVIDWLQFASVVPKNPKRHSSNP